MPSIYRPRRARASPLWQIVHHAWAPFLAEYEADHRKTHGPLRKDAVAVVDQFYKCGDLAAGFTRLHCPDCGHEKLLAFSCKTRHFCPSCHQRKVKQVGHWIAYDVCFNVPHRQFVFTIPKPLRGIFRKRRKLLDLLFHEAIACLQDWFRTRLNLPDGQLAAIAGVQTFGDYLGFHPHLHVIAPSGLIDKDGTFHEMPVESVKPLEDLFRHRFLSALRREKLISEKKLRQLLGWTHSGFNLDAGEEPIASHDPEGRRRLAEYLLRAPFSLEKITWNESTGKVIYRSSRSWHTKQNFQIFTAGQFLAAAIEHIPPKGQQTVRYYGPYSNKRRGMDAKAGRARPESPSPPRTPQTVPPPPEPKSARALRPLWRELIRQTWGVDPMECPCCHGMMKNAGKMLRREEIEFFLQLHGLWEGVLSLPPPPDPPYDIESIEPTDVPPVWVWAGECQPPPAIWWQHGSPVKPKPAHPELDLGEGRILVLDGEAAPDDWPVFSNN